MYIDSYASKPHRWFFCLTNFITKIDKSYIKTYTAIYRLTILKNVTRFNKV